MNTLHHLLVINHSTPPQAVLVIPGVPLLVQKCKMSVTNFGGDLIHPEPRLLTNFTVSLSSFFISSLKVTTKKRNATINRKCKE